MLYSMGVARRILPLYIVAIQLNILTPVGTEIRNVTNEKNGSSTAPVANMWCAQTLNDSAPIDSVANTNARYPNRGLRLKTGMISDTIPKAGRIRM